MVEVVLPKKIIAKPARGKSSSKKSSSSSKIIANYQKKNEKHTGKANSSKGNLVFQSNEEKVEHE